MKKIGVILIILQLVSFIAPLIRGDNIFGNGFANLLGRCAFGIAGVILLIVANKRNKNDKEE